MPRRVNKKVARKMAMPYVCSRRQSATGCWSWGVRYSAPVCISRHLVPDGVWPEPEAEPTHKHGTGLFGCRECFADVCGAAMGGASPVGLAEVGLTLAEVSSYEDGQHQQHRK